MSYLTINESMFGIMTNVRKTSVTTDFSDDIFPREFPLTVTARKRYWLSVMK